MNENLKTCQVNDLCEQLNAHRSEVIQSLLDSGKYASNVTMGHPLTQEQLLAILDRFEATPEVGPHEQIAELARCASDFSYFCDKYVKVDKWLWECKETNIVPMKLHSHQSRLANFCDNNRFVIGKKFRQGGFSVLLAIRHLWKCLFKLDQHCMFITKMDRQAIWTNNVVQKAIARLPQWMRPASSRTTDHFIEFDETGGSIWHLTPTAACAKAASDLVIDDPAFIKDMDSLWKAVYPVLATGGSCVCISTPNGNRGWFYESYQAALRGENEFAIYTCRPEEHEMWTPEWVAQTKSNLGEKGWRYEMEMSFE